MEDERVPPQQFFVTPEERRLWLALSRLTSLADRLTSSPWIGELQKVWGRNNYRTLRQELQQAKELIEEES